LSAQISVFGTTPQILEEIPHIW